MISTLAPWPRLGGLVQPQQGLGGTVDRRLVAVVLLGRFESRLVEGRGRGGIGVGEADVDRLGALDERGGVDGDVAGRLGPCRRGRPRRRVRGRAARPRGSSPPPGATPAWSAGTASPRFAIGSPPLADSTRPSRPHPPATGAECSGWSTHGGGGDHHLVTVPWQASARKGPDGRRRMAGWSGRSDPMVSPSPPPEGTLRRERVTLGAGWRCSRSGLSIGGVC